MANKNRLKESFDVESQHGAFYTGGNVEWYDDFFYCQGISTISVFDTNTGTVIKTIGDESKTDPDTIQTFTVDQEKVITSHKSGLFKLWSDKCEMEKMWKYIHKGPVVRLTLKSGKLASGGSDSSIRIWDLDHKACVLNLRNSQGVLNVVEFHPEENTIFGSGDDGKINVWSLQTGKLTKAYDAHLSKVTSIAFHHNSKYFVSSGRDKVLILWDMGRGSVLRTVPVFEAVEAIVTLPVKFRLPNFKSLKEGVYVAIAGESGSIRVWDVKAPKEIFAQEEPFITPIVKLLFNRKDKALATVTADQNIIVYSLKRFECLKQFVGFSDEILDVTFLGENDSHLAVATNSADIKLYRNSTMNCRLLKGHTDLVLALNRSKFNPNLMLSSSKDKTIRLWLLREDEMVCLGTGISHAASVGSVFFGYTSAKFAASASQDSCVKLWKVPTEENGLLTCAHTALAHEKDINCITVSPNDKIIATGSQDKTAKLWSETLTLIGVLRGHKRGIWCVCFSPVDQVVLTSSADCTIKLWSVSDLNCLKTLEGHESSVLRAEFITTGTQILTVGADSLIKMFNVKTSECDFTLDRHEGKIWALAIKSDESGFVTGGSDSLLIKWKDVTESKRAARMEEKELEALQEQQLSNFIQNDELVNALNLALKLDRPLQVLKIVRTVVKNQNGASLAEAIKALREDRKESLLKCTLSWNTNSRNCQPAQLVLNALMIELQLGTFKPSNLSSTLESALPYTERHFKRITHLLQDLHFINYTITCVEPHARQRKLE